MFEVVDEGIGGALELDVVVPEGVVGVDQHGLAFGSVSVHPAIIFPGSEHYVRPLLTCR
jgi:hypothetical protein